MNFLKLIYIHTSKKLVVSELHIKCFGVLHVIFFFLHFKKCATLNIYECYNWHKEMNSIWRK